MTAREFLLLVGIVGAATLVSALALWFATVPMTP